MVGLRFFNVKDDWQRQNYNRIDPVTGVIQVDGDDNPFEVFGEDTSNTDNKMFGGQLGGRYFKYQNRFLMSTEFKAFALANFQSHRSVSEQVTTTYDGVGTDSGVISILVERNGLAWRDNDEFVLGFDLRADLSYQLSRQFQIRAGLQMIDLGQGLWRGQLDSRTDQSLVMAGFTFGFALNR
jgi:bisphosphoglycerate-independent phosphoglycerate mutase (AlkP superfamily)